MRMLPVYQHIRCRMFLGVIMEFLSAGLLILLALIHSFMGEGELLGPLFKEDWSFKGIPRPIAEVIFRFAWHLTSLAWVALAAILLGGDIFIVIGLQSLVACVVIFFMLRGHLAWPLFLGSAIAAFSVAGLISATLIYGAAIATALALSLVGLLHIYWAFGGKIGVRLVIPEIPGKPALQPPMVLTLLVAMLLFAMSTGLWMYVHSPSTITHVISSAIAIIMLARALGDFKYVGFMKTYRVSDFAHYDDLLFTPFVVFIAIGSGLAVL